MNQLEPKTKLCLLRDIYRLIKDYEIKFQTRYDLCLNEGMTLCSLKEDKLSSSGLAEKLGLSSSNMSKVIKSIEDKKLIKRLLGEEDKRQMYFILTPKGIDKLNDLRDEEATIGTILASVYETQLQ